MPKKYIVIGMMLVLLVVGLCGCNGTDFESESVDALEVVEHKLRTIRYYYQGPSNRLREILVPDGDTFVYHPDMEAYEVHGKIKNDMDNNAIDYFTMYVNYLDSGRKILHTQTQGFDGINSYGTRDFLFVFNHPDLNEIVHDVGFYFSIRWKLIYYKILETSNKRW